MAEMMDSCEMTVMNIDRKWKHGNKSVGIDLTKIDDSNHLKLWIYQMCIVLICRGRCENAVEQAGERETEEAGS